MCGFCVLPPEHVYKDGVMPLVHIGVPRIRTGIYPIGHVLGKGGCTYVTLVINTYIYSLAQIEIDVKTK